MDKIGLLHFYKWSLQYSKINIQKRFGTKTREKVFKFSILFERLLGYFFSMWLMNLFCLNITRNTRSLKMFRVKMISQNMEVYNCCKIIINIAWYLYKVFTAILVSRSHKLFLIPSNVGECRMAEKIKGWVLVIRS